MTSAQVVETSVTVTNNSPFQDYPHPDDHTTHSTVTPGFKPFTVKQLYLKPYLRHCNWQGMLCKELTLPASELYNVADLVCVMSPSGDSNLSDVSVMAVSPEGLVRYWPSLTYDSNTVDIDTDLIGSQCHSLTAFQV